ncbi:AraC family transcriptional regulator [Arcicella aurantiaca]|uniref:AraC family transcriptional regulator n=1 Tax=Arcicella aurantiaca TaxID=591202 RepID=A0A316DHK2_9BACT|nr:AraC family transcriptional regulator [Arcicella aurantiaca]PWK16083.1 AraC family transcriptional regulator [Arcicella aurantiaca]
MDLEQIQHIVKYVEDNFHRNIPIEELEDIGCYSYRNLQRVFQNIFEETLGAFQKRLKLENGYKKLIYTSDIVTDIAFSVGFESLQAFTKSFKKQFQISPTEARNNKLKIFESFLHDVQNKPLIQPEIVYLNPIQIYYQSIKTSNYNNYEIEKHWDKIDQIFHKNNRVSYYGIIVDQPLITIEKHCRYEACVTEYPNDKSYLTKEILGRKYAKYIHKGDYEQIEDTYRMIYKDWLLKAKLEFDSSPVIEHYLIHDFDTDEKDSLITEILFPLKKI